LLILAGYETTVNLIGNGILALLRNPAELATPREQPLRIRDPVEEFLRFDGPVNVATTRFTAVAIRIGDVTIPANEFVMISLLAANRNDDQFEDPDRLDIARKPDGHLAFGHGIHYCLGAPLTRLETQIAVAKRLARFDRMTLDGTATLEYRDSTLMRGHKALPVRVGDTLGVDGVNRRTSRMGGDAVNPRCCGSPRLRRRGATSSCCAPPARRHCSRAVPATADFPRERRCQLCSETAANYVLKSDIRRLEYRHIPACFT
jgi:hypothetical protein